MFILSQWEPLKIDPCPFDIILLVSHGFLPNLE
jgi:hypothetical protein